MRHRSGSIAGVYEALHAVEVEQFARLEAWDMASPQHRYRLDLFESSRPVTVRVWELPGAALSGYRSAHRHEQVQVDPDGRLTLMRAVVFVGHRGLACDDPTSQPQRYGVGEEPAVNGDTTDRLIGLGELAQHVDDIADWQAPRSW